jgi:putative hydrolase of the HAD superfamily
MTKPSICPARNYADMNELCVVFDIDDTLYLERDYVRSGFQAVGKWAGDWLAIDDFFGACWREFESGQRSTIFNRALAACGKKPSPELISCLVELYRSHTPCIVLTPDASEALGQIAGTCPIAIVSDGPVAAQSRKADALGLRSVASPVVLTGIFGAQFCKPHTHAFAHVAESVPARRYAYVADNPAKDFAGPNELGWTTIRIRRPGGLHVLVENNPHSPPNVEVSDCSDLVRVLARV